MSASLRARRDHLRAEVRRDAADGPAPRTATNLARVGRAAQVVALTALLKTRKKVTGRAHP